ncbi:hypothetical protein LOK46_05730 [Methylobacterium sp. NMS14P]|uniref:hypothetical protein n=1 Tax=Methylobacterium sp. NMS14P TaxID=2894310 RepID=UPI0023581AB3|nr:hypothetical protein [Methylobacterium sp. NMS14P]WCS26335.1 hypothetical protein LOK46_05730 [Methylobacterium sp. NMS14P]
MRAANVPVNVHRQRAERHTMCARTHKIVRSEKPRSAQRFFYGGAAVEKIHAFFRPTALSSLAFPARSSILIALRHRAGPHPRLDFVR